MKFFLIDISFRIPKYIISDNLHHSVNYIVYHRGCNVVFGCYNKVDSKLFSKKVLYDINMLYFEYFVIEINLKTQVGGHQARI